MNLIKTSLLSFIATMMKLLSALVINKAIALYIGPSGLAMLGQFQSFSQISQVFSQGAINTGVTKYTSEYGLEKSKLSVLFSTSIRITIVCSVLTGVFCIAFSRFLAELVFNSYEFSYVFLVFGFTIILFSINQLLLSILNGIGEIKKYIAINISQSVYGLFFTTILIYFFDIDGALIALATNQSIVFVFSLLLLRKHFVFDVSLYNLGFDKLEAKKLFDYSLMAIVGMLSLPMSIFMIRGYIVESLGGEYAGYWQAVWSISSMYLMIVTTAITVYFIPNFSRLKEKHEIKKELIHGYTMIVPFFIIMGGGIFFFKTYIIQLLFSDDFLPAVELFQWQLFGDLIKVCGLLLANLALSKALVKRYILVEVLFSLFFISSTLVLIGEYNLVGVTYAYVISYFLYFLMIFCATKKVFL